MLFESSANTVLFGMTGYFLLTTFRDTEVYSDSCPQALNFWLPIAFIQFYMFQAIIITFMSIENKSMSLLLFYFASFGLVPWITIFNIFGNLLNEQISRTENCTANGYARTYSMIYIIATYCVLFVYIIFAAAVKESMKRYFVAVYTLTNDDQVQEFVDNDEDDT